VTLDCLTCKVSAAWPDLPPREAVYIDDDWRVAVSFDSALPGWLVLLPRRHVTAIHELTSAEVAPLGPMVLDLSRALAEVTGCEKTYVMQFAEHPEHRHVHFHVVPRMPDWPEEVRGPGVFHFLQQPEADQLDDAQRDDIALRLRGAL
jgi:diadenosine tetraphosphate (Ap4A) HIT family hydrolase